MLSGVRGKQTTPSMEYSSTPPKVVAIEHQRERERETVLAAASSFQCYSQVPPSLLHTGEEGACGRAPSSACSLLEGESKSPSTASLAARCVSSFWTTGTSCSQHGEDENQHLNICICLSGFLCGTGMWKLSNFF